MVRIVELGEETARVKHATCGATVEFTRADVRGDRDGRYVVCPCGRTPWIVESVLKWKRRRSALLPASRPHAVRPYRMTIEEAERQIEAEDRADRARRDSPEDRAAIAENERRSSLPPEHPDHCCGLMCDGQDGASSYCARLRAKLFG